MTPFDFVKAINETKEDMSLQCEDGYAPFIVNKQLSYFADTVMFANEMNIHHGELGLDQQFEFLKGSIRKKKRFSKWAKQTEESDLIATISDYFCYNSELAKETELLLTCEQKQTLRDLYKVGGR